MQLKTAIALCLCAASAALASLPFALRGEMDMDLDTHMHHEEDGHSPDMETETVSTTADEHLLSLETPIPHVDKHHHGMPILETPLLPLEKEFWENYNTTTFFTVQTEHKSALYYHIGFLFVSFVLIYPICLVLNNVRSSWYYPALLLHSTLAITSFFCLSVFFGSAPDLYPNNAYTKMTWIYFFETILLVFFAITSFGFKAIGGDSPKDYFSISDEESHLETCVSPTLNSAELGRNSRNSFELNDLDPDAHLKTSNNSMLDPKEVKNSSSKIMNKLVNYPIIHKIVTFFGRFSVYIFNILSWTHFFYFLVYLPTAVATFFCLGQGKSVFNLLAHFIKGGVFFSLGLLSLARYSGGFANKGWSWNHRFITTTEVSQSRWNRLQSKGLITMEMVESSLILFYGSTNIFLEHLSNPGGEWSAKDLQHVSIAFIYIGCGCCGVLTEMKLANWRHEKALENLAKVKPEVSSHKIVKASPGFSPNPFPILTIFWTGVLMSKHAQASALSTEIHMQWGNMFVYGTLFRFLTYVLLQLLPVNNRFTEPLRPITELITSFTLLCGGLIFMESTDPIVLALEYRGFTSMFTLNLSLGVVALFMAWEMLILAYRDRLVKRMRSNSSCNIS